LRRERERRDESGKKREWSGSLGWRGRRWRGEGRVREERRLEKERALKLTLRNWCDLQLKGLRFH